MAVDCNELNLAERYYIQALRLADAADSRRHGAQVMATHMGHLALYAEHPREAVQLAEAARSGTRQKTEPLAAAVTWVVEARGYARMGDTPRLSTSPITGRAILLPLEPVGGSAVPQVLPASLPVGRFRALFQGPEPTSQGKRVRPSRPPRSPKHSHSPPGDQHRHPRACMSGEQRARGGRCARARSRATGQ